MLQTTSVSLYGDYQVSKTVTSGELAEHKNFELIPARKVLYVAVTVILSNDPVELATVQE